MVVQISGRKYLFFRSDTGHQLFKCQIAQISGFYMFKGSAVCKSWGWPKLDQWKIFRLRGHGNGALKSENTRNLCNLCQIYGFGGDMAE